MKHISVLILGLAVIGASYGPAYAAGDAAKGETLFKRCVACHTAESGGKHKVGPNLFGVVGRSAYTVDGFKYSKSAQKAAEAIGSWDEEKLINYLIDPSKFLKEVSGDKKAKSKMTFKLPKEDDRADVVAYLQTLK